MQKSAEPAIRLHNIRNNPIRDKANHISV